MENGGIDWISMIPNENDQKFIDTLLWAKTEFKKKVEELGIPKEYFEYKNKHIKKTMKALSNIQSSSFVSIDIETVRIKENFIDLSEEWQSAWEYKNKQDGEVPNVEELAVLWADNASLYPEFSKVVAISSVVLGNGVLKCKSYASEDEEVILEEFAKDLASLSAAQREFLLTAHAGKFFDFPFLCKRYIANGMPIPDMLDESDLKPWERKQLDTNELWKSFGGHGSSLQALCTMMGIPVSKVDLVGDEVGAAYFRGEILRIADYCNKDAIAEFNLLRKFKGETIFQFEEVVYVNEGVILVKEDIFKRIQKAGGINDRLQEEICDTAKSLSAKDRKSFVKFIIAALNKPEAEYTAQEVALFEVLNAKPAKVTSKKKTVIGEPSPTIMTKNRH